MADYKINAYTQYINFADYSTMVFLTYSSYSGFPNQGETGKYYYDSGADKTYIWNGTSYVEIASGKNAPMAYVKFVDENGTANYIWGKPIQRVRTGAIGSPPYIYHNDNGNEYWVYDDRLTEKVTRTASNYKHATATGILADQTQLYAGDDLTFEYGIKSGDSYANLEFISASCQTQNNSSFVFAPITTTLDTDCRTATTQSFRMPYGYRPQLVVGTWTTVWTGSQQMTLNKTTDTSIVFNNTISGLLLPSGKIRIYVNVTPSSFYDPSEGYAAQGRLPQTYTGSYGTLKYVWDVIGLTATTSTTSSSLDGSVVISISAGADANRTSQDITYNDVYVTKIEVLLENQPTLYDLNLVCNANIASISYKFTGEAEYRTVYSTTTIKVPLNTGVQVYATPVEYYTTTYNSSNPISTTITSSGYTFSPTATAIPWTTVWTGNKKLASSSSTSLIGLPLPSGRVRVYIKITPNYWQSVEDYAVEGQLPKEFKGYYYEGSDMYYTWECYQIDSTPATASDTYNGSMTVYMRAGQGGATSGQNMSYDKIYMTKIECQGSW